MRADGFYLSAGSGLLPGLPRVTSEECYASVVDALCGDGILVDAATGALVLRFEAGRPVEVFVRAGCSLCEKPVAPFTAAMVAFCTPCLPLHLRGPELSVGDLEGLFGLPVSTISIEVWRPLRERFLRERSRLNTVRLEPHLVVLSDPDRVEGWLLEHGDDGSLCVSLLSRMLATGSLLGEHRFAATLLARHSRPLLEAVSVSPQVQRMEARGLSPLEVFLDLARS